ncbi:MAG: hypothetical protein ACE5PV_01150 [Candidatus Poribacteria bacterium]
MLSRNTKSGLLRKPLNGVNRQIIAFASILCLLIIGIASAAFAAAYNGECWVVNGGSSLIVRIIPATGEIDLNNMIDLNPAPPADYAVVNPRDGALWVALSAANSVFKFNFDGSQPIEIKFTGSQTPRSISIDTTDGSAWVGTDSGVFKVSADGKTKKQVASTGDEARVSVNIADSSCWVADSSGKVMKYSKTGQKLLDASLTKALTEPKYIAVNSTTGNVWVADSQAGILVKLDANGKELLRTTEVGMPVSPSVNFKTGDLWVADAKNFQIVKISANGKVSKTIPGFTFPASVSVNSKTGDVWVADQFANSVTKIPANGQPVSVPGFTLPISVSVGYWEEK